MNSPFANIYLEIMARITDQVPAIIFMDMDYGQLEHPEGPQASMPCVLIDFQNWTFDDLGALAQNATGKVILKLATDPYSSSSNITPETFKEDAISIFDLEWAVYKALHGWSPASGGVMGRIANDSDNRRPGMKVRIMTYDMCFQDYSAKRQKQTVAKPAPDIT